MRDRPVPRPDAPARAMQILPIDLTALILGALGISIVLVPVIGLTARFALKPVVEALARVFEVRGEDEAMRILERRLDLQEQEIMMLHQTMRALTDAQEFDRRLTGRTEAAGAGAAGEETTASGDA